MASFPILLLLALLALVSSDRIIDGGCWRITPQSATYYTDPDCTRLPAAADYASSGDGNGYSDNSRTGTSGGGGGNGHGPYSYGQGQGQGFGSGGRTWDPGSFGANGPAIVQSVVQTVNAFAQVFGGTAQAQEERKYQYQAYDWPSDTNPEQKAREYEASREERFQKQAHEINQRVVEISASPEQKQFGQYLKNFEAIVNNFEAQIKKIHSESPILASVEKPTRTQLIADKLKSNEYGLYGKRIRNLLDNANSLDSIYGNNEKSDFLIKAAQMADQLLDKYEITLAQSPGRWLDRGEMAHAYWTNEKVRLTNENAKLLPRAQNTFLLPNIASNSFENYEIIQAANALSIEPEITGDEFRRLQVALALNQAQSFAEEGETFASALMLENAYSVRDFVRGIYAGAGQNIYDTITGTWHLVRHPIDTAAALKYALVNYQQTYELIIGKAKEVFKNYHSYSSEEKGRLVGYLAVEIFATVGTTGGGWTAKLVKSTRFAKSVEAALEETTKLLETQGINKFESAVAALSDTGKKNVEYLRGWAKEQGYVVKDNPLGKPEEWGVLAGERFEWRLKIKPIAGIREELHPDSKIPRAAARLDNKGTFINPFTHETGGSSIGAHIALDYDWLSGRKN